MIAVLTVIAACDRAEIIFAYLNQFKHIFWVSGELLALRLVNIYLPWDSITESIFKIVKNKLLKRSHS